MNRLFSIVLMMCVSVSANAGLDDLGSISGHEQEKQPGLHGVVGIAAAGLPEYSGSDQSTGALLPLINVDYNDTFYFHINRLGWWAYKSASETTRVGLIAKTRRERDSGSTEDLDNTDDRDASFGLGVALKSQLGVGSVNFDIVYDVSDNSDGAWAELGYKYPLYRDTALQLTMGLAVEWLSSDVTDYYYGIKNSEAAPGRAAYDADSVFNGRINLVGNYSLGHNWALIGGLVYTYFGDEIEDSPIVEENGDLVGFLGVGWKF